jgi:uncharacterized repeat protein (TIGR04076 family)
MPKLKITVLKTTFNHDLAAEYAAPDAGPCPYFTERQEFMTERGCPENFCPWAWNDLFRSYWILRFGGAFTGWSKNARSIVKCCTHGIRPVIFNLEWLEDDPQTD